MNDEIKVLVLADHPPIIAKTKTEHRENGDCYVLEDPLNIMYSQNTQNNSPVYAVQDPLTLSTDSTIEILPDRVLYTYNPLPEIIAQYNYMLLNTITPIPFEENDEKPSIKVDVN